jgi:hypothetical protein
MQEGFYTNETMRKQLLGFLERTFNYDGTVHLLVVSARRVGARGQSGEPHWRLRVALTYEENDTINPYWDGTELYIALVGDSIWLLDESVLANEPPIID